MKKTILAIIGLTISLNSMAQMPTKIWVTNPKSNDTIGYIDQKYQQFIVTRQITQLEFDKLQNMYLGAYTIVTREGQIIDQYKPQPVVSSSTTSPIDINSRGFYLVKAGEYKNASIAVSLGTSMTEEIFTELNFEKNVVTMDESGNDKDFYYYSLDIGDICIISNADDEAEKNGWEAYIFDSLTMRVKGSGDLEDLVRIIRNNTNG
jgi:hypothetical protein